MHNSAYANVGQAFRSVYKAEGITAFYVSYPTTLMMTIPFTATQFTCVYLAGPRWSGSLGADVPPPRPSASTSTSRTSSTPLAPTRP